MPDYIVRFITDRELIERSYEAPTAQDCLDRAEAHFSTWNADHGELHEVVVCPPEGSNRLTEFDPNPVLEFYRLTEAGRRTVHERAEAALARMPAAERREIEQRITEIRAWRRQRRLA